MSFKPSSCSSFSSHNYLTSINSALDVEIKHSGKKIRDWQAGRRTWPHPKNIRSVRPLAGPVSARPEVRLSTMPHCVGYATCTPPPESQLIQPNNSPDHLISQISARKSGSRLLTSLRSKHVLELRFPRDLNSTRAPSNLAKATTCSFFR